MQEKCASVRHSGQTNSLSFFLDFVSIAIGRVRVREVDGGSKCLGLSQLEALPLATATGCIWTIVHCDSEICQAFPVVIFIGM